MNCDTILSCFFDVKKYPVSVILSMCMSKGGDGYLCSSISVKVDPRVGFYEEALERRRQR